MLESARGRSFLRRLENVFPQVSFFSDNLGGKSKRGKFAREREGEEEVGAPTTSSPSSPFLSKGPEEIQGSSRVEEGRGGSRRVRARGCQVVQKNRIKHLTGDPINVVFFRFSLEKYPEKLFF